MPLMMKKYVEKELKKEANYDFYVNLGINIFSWKI
jgi:hypothetical protein